MKKNIFKAALIFCMILCLASGLAVFSACTVGQKDAGEDTSGITSGDSDSDGDNTGDNDGGDTSGDSDNTGDNTGDETGDNTGDNTGDDTGTPPAEITEEQYAEQNIELLKEICIGDYKTSNPLFEISNIQIVVINKACGNIYFKADQHILSNKINKFFTAKFDKNIFNSTHKILNETLNKIVKGETENNVEFLEPQTILQPEISEELFDEFCDYIKRQSYTYGDEVIDFSATDPQNLEIINVTNSYIRGGYICFDFVIINPVNGKIYNGNIMGALGSSAVDDQIIELMGKTTNIFEITEVSDFEEFELAVSTTLDILLFLYGNGKNLKNDTLAMIKDFNQYAPFPDSIRMLVAAEDGNQDSVPIANTNKHWNWLIDPNANYPTTNDLNPSTSPDESINNVNYQTWKNNAISLIESYNSYSFPDYMQDIFLVVLYEIMLGIEPTEIEVSYENVTNFFYTDHGGSYTIDSGKLYTVKISSSSTLTDITDNVIYQIIYNDNSSALIKNITNVDYKDKIRPKVSESLDKLQENYLSNSRYIGLTKENADKLISYILNEMIGADLVAYDYNTYRNQPVNYRNYVATIANLIYIQTYDGSGDDWEYVFIGSGGQEISFMFEGFNTTTGVKPEGSFTAKPATFVRYYPCG